METIHRFVGLRRDAKPRAIQYSSIKYRSSAIHPDDALGLAPRAGVRSDGASSACREYPVCIPAGTPVYQPAQPNDDSEPYATAALQAAASAARRRAAALSALRHGGSGSGGGGEGREQYEAVWEV